MKHKFFSMKHKILGSHFFIIITVAQRMHIYMCVVANENER